MKNLTQKSLEKFYVKSSLTIYLLILLAMFLVSSFSGCKSHKHSQTCFAYSQDYKVKAHKSMRGLGKVIISTKKSK